MFDRFSLLLQSEEEAASVARVLEFYVSNFAVLSRRVYWTPSGVAASKRLLCAGTSAQYSVPTVT